MIETASRPPSSRFRAALGSGTIQISRALGRVLIAASLVWLWLRRRLARDISAPPVYVDVGASGGFQSKWQLAAKLGLVRLVGFEPNAAACRDLQQRDQTAQYLPYALADKDGELLLHLTRDPGCSSCLPPALDTLKNYPIGRLFEVVGTATVPARSFQSLAKSGGVPTPDFLKLDVQGFEYEILAGFGEHLQKVIGIELETHTRALYIGQKTMPDIVAFLAAHNFQLRRIEQQGNFEGECLELNLFFSRVPNSLTATDHPKLILWEMLSHVPDAAIYHSQTSPPGEG